MADVYISYAREDHRTAEELARVLESHGYTVWWDRHLIGGEDFRSIIDAQITNAKCVIVLWSAASTRSSWTIEEASFAQDQNKYLPVVDELRDSRAIPLGFHQHQSFELRDERALLRAVAAQVERGMQTRARPSISKRFSELLDFPARVTAENAKLSASVAPRPKSTEQLALLRQDTRRATHDQSSVGQAVEELSIHDIRASMRRSPVGYRYWEDQHASSSPSRTPPPLTSPSSGKYPPKGFYEFPRPQSRFGRPLLIVAAAAIVGAAGAYLVAGTRFEIDLLGKLLAVLKLNSAGPLPSLPVPPDGDLVDCSVFCPPRVPTQSEFFVQVFLHDGSQLDRVTQIASTIDEDAKLRGVATLQTEIARGEKIAVTFDGRGLTAEMQVQELTWRGNPQAVNFLVTMPDAKAGTSFKPIVRLSVKGVPIGFVQFSVTATQSTERLEAAAQGSRSKRYKYAFISYASEDRKRVLDYARALKAANIDFFQDVLALEPGQRWEQRLYQEIDKADLFMLFWSKSSASSEWVMKEIKYARSLQSEDQPPPDITPINLDGTPAPKEPAWLRGIHFDDHFRLIIEATPERPSNY